MKSQWNLGYIGFHHPMISTITAWWFQPTPLKNMKVTWDDYPTYYGNINVPNHQPVLYETETMKYQFYPSLQRKMIAKLQHVHLLACNKPG